MLRLESEEVKCFYRSLRGDELCMTSMNGVLKYW